MPRSHPASAEWRALLAATFALLVFTSLIIVKAGAQGRRAPVARRSTLQQNITGVTTPQQARRKSIASIRSVETPEGSRVTITSDVPLNDYSAYVNGDRYYVVIPESNLVSQNIKALENALRGRGFQDVKIEKRGNDVVISFRLLPGMRARVEQKFNRLDVLFTAPGGAVTYNTNQTTNSGPRTPDEIIRSNQQTNTTANQSSTGTGTTYTGTGTQGGATVATNRGGAGSRGGRTRGGYRSGYGGGGGGGGGGGVPLDIPLPSQMALPQASPTASPGASPYASPLASPTTVPQVAQSSPQPSPTSQTSPEQIAQTQPPVTAPPGTAPNPATTAPAAPSSGASLGAALRNNWLPLLIVLLILASVGMLLVSRSRARASAAAPPPAASLGTAKKSTGKASPGSAAVATLAGGAAGAAAATAASRKSAAPVEEPAKPAQTRPVWAKTTEAQTKEVEPVVPAASPERVGTEIKGLLEGGNYDAAVVGSTNPATRQLVATELLAALASRNPDRRARARAAYTKHGFFDEATQNLRTAENPAERISAARALGLTQDTAATPHLVAALEDNEPEVRRSSVNALAELRDPSAIGPLNALLEREKNRKVPHSLIRRAIEASATIDVAESPKASAAPTPVAETPATAADKKDKDDDEDREVFEI